MILICDTECWTEPRPATTGNIKIKKQALVSPALSKCIGCWHWLEKNHCAFWEQSETERSGTLQNCQMILQLSQTQQQIHCKQWLFCPTTTTKMGFRYHFFRLQREKWFNEFCYCSHSSNNKRPHSVEGWCCFCNLGVKCVLCIAACIVTATVRLTPHWPSQSWCPG